MQDKYKIVKIRERNKYLEVYWCDNHISKFHFLWLRDNCPTAFHKDTRMRNFNILSVTNKIRPKNFRFTKKSLHVSWRVLSRAIPGSLLRKGAKLDAQSQREIYRCLKPI
mgnify:CR=1 FL=1